MCTDSRQIFYYRDYVNNNTPTWVKEYQMKEKDGHIIFKKKNNRVCAVNVSIWSILWNYICWVLAGKPDSHIV